MPLHELYPRPTLRFEAMRRRRAWHELPGLLALVSALALWIVLATGVVAPLGEALARLRQGASAAPAVECGPAVDGALVARSQPCPPGAPPG